MRTILLVTTRKAAGRHVCCLELIVDIAKKKKKTRGVRSSIRDEAGL